MNLAASTLLIFLLVSPALIARRFYYTRELSRSYTSRNTLQEIFSSIFLCVLLHSLWIFIAREYKGLEINYEVLFKLLFSADKADYSQIDKNLKNVFLYFISLFVFSILAGVIIKQVVRNLYLDRYIRFLRYDNKWYYLVSGEILDIPDLNVYKEDPLLYRRNISGIYADVLVKSDSKIIYTGVIVDYQLAENNSVEYFVLARAIKQSLEVSLGSDNKPIKDKVTGTVKLEYVSSKMADSKYFVIPYSDVLNINFRYIKTGNKPNLNLIWRIYSYFATVREFYDELKTRARLRAINLQEDKRIRKLNKSS